jgi:drug/metabolite transporter (DMT)-like permease
MNRFSVSLFVLLAFIWGASFTFIKVSLGGLTPGQLVLTRLVFGAAFLLIVISVSGVRLPAFGSVWAHLAVTATLGMVTPFLLLAWGERHVSAALAGVLIGAIPLITLALATVVLPDERATVVKVVGLVIGFVGVVVVLSPWSAVGGTLGGQLAVLGAGASYAAQTVYIRRVLSARKIPPLALATSQLIVAVIVQAIITPFTGWAAPSFTLPVTASIVLLGVVGTGVGYVIYFRLINDMGATTASTVNYLVPVTAVLVGMVTLGERITLEMVFGTIVVLLGLAVAERRVDPTRLRRRRLPDTAGPAAGGASSGGWLAWWGSGDA